MIRRIRAWRRVTTPPAVIPIMVVALVAMFVAQVAIAWIGGLIAIAWVFIAHWELLDEWWFWAGVGSQILLTPVVFALWWAVRLLVGSWVRAQPPDPPRE